MHETGYKLENECSASDVFGVLVCLWRKTHTLMESHRTVRRARAGWVGRMNGTMARRAGQPLQVHPSRVETLFSNDKDGATVHLEAGCVSKYFEIGVIEQ